MRPSSQPDIMFDPTADWMTWLPYVDFVQTFECLDPYRLGRTSFEASQVLDSLVGIGRDKLYKHHICTRLWRGYESALAFYVSLSIREMHVRGFRTLRVSPYDFYGNYRIDTHYFGYKKLLPFGEYPYPPWLGLEWLHSSHRAGLLKLEPKFYIQHGWTEDPDTPLWWPEGINEDADSNSKQGKIPALSEINAEVDT